MTQTFTLFAEASAGLSIRAVASQNKIAHALAEHPVYVQELQRIRQKIASGQGFDGLRYPVNAIEINGNSLVLHCQELRYSEAVAMNAVRAHLYDATTPEAFFPVSRHMGSALGVITTVITADGQVLVHQRSGRVGDCPLHWAIAFGEGVTAEDLGTASLAGAALRCLREELNLTNPQVAQARVLLPGLVRHRQTLGWDVYAVVDARGLQIELFSAAAILAGARNAADAWEHSQLEAVPQDELIPFLEGKLVTPATSVFLGLLMGYLKSTSAQ